MSGIPLRWILGAIAAVAVVLACWWLVGSLSGGKRAAIEAKLEADRGDAMAQSGADGVNTVGARNAAEDATDEEVRHAQQAIDDAEDLGGSDAAARNGLCDISPDYC